MTCARSLTADACYPIGRKAERPGVCAAGATGPGRLAHCRHVNTTNNISYVKKITKSNPRCVNAPNGCGPGRERQLPAEPSLPALPPRGLSG